FGHDGLRRFGFCFRRGRLRLHYLVARDLLVDFRGHVVASLAPKNHAGVLCGRRRRCAAFLLAALAGALLRGFAATLLGGLLRAFLCALARAALLRGFLRALAAALLRGLLRALARAALLGGLLCGFLRGLLRCFLRSGLLRRLLCRGFLGRSLLGRSCRRCRRCFRHRITAAPRECRFFVHRFAPLAIWTVDSLGNRGAIGTRRTAHDEFRTCRSSLPSTHRTDWRRYAFRRRTRLPRFLSVAQQYRRPVRNGRGYFRDPSPSPALPGKRPG